MQCSLGLGQAAASGGLGVRLVRLVSRFCRNRLVVYRRVKESRRQTDYGER